MMICIVAVLAALLQIGATQPQARNFVINDTEPYVYLKLDHVGPRKPAMPGEPAVGVWVRIVNNCRVPIRVPTIGSDVNGISVEDEIVKYSEGVTITTGPTIDDLNPPTQSNAATSQSAPPEGYNKLASDVLSFTTVLPGSSLLFSVPINHVAGDGWYMRVRFSFDIPNSRSGPYSYADSFTIHVPPQYLQNGKPETHVFH